MGHAKVRGHLRCVAFASLLIACDRPASTTPPASASPPSATASPPSAAPWGSVSSASTVEVPAPSTPKLAPRSADMPPPPAEWEAHGRPVLVAGVADHGCTAEAIDPWLRIFCAGTGERSPQGVEVTRGGGDGMTFAVTRTGQTSLVFPFVEGVALRATFTFASGAAELRVSWPRGSAAPETRGEMKEQSTR